LFDGGAVGGASCKDLLQRTSSFILVLLDRGTTLLQICENALV
jgi:hypothetical protein